MTRSKAAVRTDRGNVLFKDTKKKEGNERSQDTPSEILVGAHSRYLIKSGRLAGEYVARAFPKPPTNARGLIAEAKGATEAAAIQALHDAIDERELRRTGERRVDAQTGTSIPSREEYIEAIRQVTLSKPQRAMLVALSLAEGDGLTERRMAYAAGYKSQASANRAFTGAGLLIGTYLSVEKDAQEPLTSSDGALLLGFRGEARNEDDPGNWILHAELREAVRSSL